MLVWVFLAPVCRTKLYEPRNQAHSLSSVEPPCRNPLILGGNGSEGCTPSIALQLEVDFKPNEGAGWLDAFMGQLTISQVAQQIGFKLQQSVTSSRSGCFHLRNA